MIFTGMVVGPEKALAMGLVNRVSSGPALPSAIDLASEMLGKGPIALRVAKIAVGSGSQIDLANGMVLEKACYAQVIPTKDRLEGLAAFKEKRKPEYKGE
jgi:methylglutaconyl-CoA hydratase